MRIADESKKLGRIGILMGGPSSEREISLRSGMAVYETLKGAGYNAVAIDAVGDVAAKIGGSRIEVAFIALHGIFGEDGTVQSMLEDMRIPYTGSGPLASRLALDKISSRRIFRSIGISVPRYRVLSSGDIVASGQMKFPVVVKPASGGSSIGLTLVHEEGALTDAINLAFQHDEWVILEEYVEGREVTVGILDDAPLPVIEVIPGNKLFDYQAKYTPNFTEYVVPAKLDPATYRAAQEAGISAHRALGCRNFSRVDIIIDKKSNLPVVLEVNTIPGLTATSLLPKAARAQGMEFLRLCEKIIYAAETKNSRAYEKVRT